MKISLILFAAIVGLSIYSSINIVYVQTPDTAWTKIFGGIGGKNKKNARKTAQQQKFNTTTSCDHNANEVCFFAQ